MNARRRNQRGAVAVEFAILLPLLVLLIGTVVAGGRLAYTRTMVQHVADAGARAASISRDAAAAQRTALDTVRADVEASGISCAHGLDTTADTSGFAVPVGQPAQVAVTVRCLLSMSDLLVPGLPGTWSVEATSTSTLDRYRGRR